MTKIKVITQTFLLHYIYFVTWENSSLKDQKTVQCKIYKSGNHLIKLVIKITNLYKLHLKIMYHIRFYVLSGQPIYFHAR